MFKKILSALFLILLLALLLTKPQSSSAQGSFGCVQDINDPDGCDWDGFDNCSSGCYVDAGLCYGGPPNNACPGSVQCVCSSLDWDLLKHIATPNPLIATGTVGSILSLLLTYMFPFIGLLLTIYIIYGGFSFMVASGDPGKIASAYRIITNGLVGFSIVFSAYWLTQMAGIILGLPDITGVF